MAKLLSEDPWSKIKAFMDPFLVCGKDCGRVTGRRLYRVPTVAGKFRRISEPLIPNSLIPQYHNTLLAITVVLEFMISCLLKENNSTASYKLP